MATKAKLPTIQVGDSLQFDDDEMRDSVGNLPSIGSPQRLPPISPKVSSPLSRTSSHSSYSEEDNEDKQDMEDDALGAAALLSTISLMVESRQALKNWKELAQQYLVEGRFNDYQSVLEKISFVLDLRRQLAAKKVENDEKIRHAIIREIVSILENSRRHVTGYIIPRKENGQMADLQNTSLLTLVKLHQAMYDANSPQARDIILNKMLQRRELMQIANRPAPLTPKTVITEEVKTATKPVTQLRVDLKAVIIPSGEPLEVRLNLFDFDKKQYLFEDYITQWTKDGAPEDRGMLGNMKVIFKDLEIAQLKAANYLIVRVYRYAPLGGDESGLFPKKKSTEVHRRPFAIGLMPLSRLSDLKDMEEIVPGGDDLKLYSVKDESHFPSLPEMIIKGSKDALPVPKVKGVVIGVSLNRTPFSSLGDEITAKSSISQSLMFSEQSSGTESRNDFYIILKSGSYAQDVKRTGRNVLVEVRIVDSTLAEVLEDCLSPSCSTQIPHSMYQSCILYHANDPEWYEILRLNLPNDQFETAHILILSKHISSKADKNQTFSFAFLPLVGKDGTVIPDGVHVLECYTPWSDVETNLRGSFYIKTDAALPTKRKDTINLVTSLCSTTKTQIDSLQSLFKWVVLKEEELPDVLDKFLTTQGLELVKFTREILDTLILILCKHQGSKMIDIEIQQACFLAILHVLDQMAGKFTRFRPLVDSYISTGFKNEEVHGTHIPLLSAASVALNYSEWHGNMKDAKRYKTLTYMAKQLRYITKLAISSFKESRQDPHSKEEFRNSFREFIVSCIKVLEISEESLIAVKGFLLRSFPTIFDDLIMIYSSDEISHIFVEVFQIIGRMQDSSLSIDVLRLIRELLSGFLGTDKICRKAVEPYLMKVLKQYLNSIAKDSIDEAYLSIAILHQELDMMHTQSLSSRTQVLKSTASDNKSGPPRILKTTSINSPDSSKGKSSYELGWSDTKMTLDIDIRGFFTILPELVRFVFAAQNDKLGKKKFPKVKETVETVAKVDTLTDSFSCLITLLFLIDETEFQDMLSMFGVEYGEAKGAEFIETLLLVVLNSLKEPMVNVYPEVWLIMKLLQFQVIFQVLSNLIPSIRKGGAFSKIIPMFLDVCLEVLHKCSIASSAGDSNESKESKENDEGQRAQEVLKGKFAVFKADAVALIKQIQEILGSEKCFNLAEYLVSSALFTLFVRGGEAGEQLGVHIFKELLKIDLQKNGSYVYIERLTFDLLYRMGLQDPPNTGKFFNALFKKLEPLLKENKAGQQFNDRMTKVYDLLGGLTSIPSTEVYETERVEVAIRLIHYLEQASNRNLYFQYVEYLVDIHLSLGCFVEAALTQLIHARKLDWNKTDQMEILGKLPAEKECDRKERLYNKVLELLSTAEEWEKMIDVYEEMRPLYANTIFDYEKLCLILREEAKLYDQILKHERFYCVYFRVGFYGSFKADIAGKEFVYKGGKLESNIDFTNRIKKKWPQSFLQMSSDIPSSEQIEKHKSIISVTTLVVSNDSTWLNPSSADRSKRKIHKNIKKFLMNNNSNVFMYKKPVSKSKEEKPKNEFKDLWVLQTLIRTEERFPTIKRRLEVVERKEIWITPIENATNVVREKSDELEDKIEKVLTAAEGQVDVGPLSMTLNGIIDAAVNGGTKKYVDAFLSPEFAAENPSLVSWQKELTEALEDQVRLLRKGLDVFGSKCGEQLQGLHQHLSKMLGEMVDQTKQLLH